MTNCPTVDGRLTISGFSDQPDAWAIAPLLSAARSMSPTAFTFSGRRLAKSEKSSASANAGRATAQALAKAEATRTHRRFFMADPRLRGPRAARRWAKQPLRPQV